MRRLPHILIATSLLVAVDASTSVAAPADAFTAPALTVGVGPPNGDFSQGTVGWTVVGPRSPNVTVSGSVRYLRLAANTTLVSSPMRVSRSAQTLRVQVRSRSRGGVLLVRALRKDGRQVTLGTIAPAGGFQQREVGLGAVRGATVRIVLDPVTSLGRTVDVRKVGPQRRVAPGWTIERGAPQRIRKGLVAVSTGVLRMRSVRFRLPSRQRVIRLQIKGTGTARLVVSGRSARATATTRRWRTLKVRVSPRTLRTRVRIIANPRAGSLQLRRIGATSRR